MKKTILCVIMIISLIVGIYALIDLLRSIYYVLSYESLTVYAGGVIFGKLVFVMICVVIFILSKKNNRKI